MSSRRWRWWWQGELPAAAITVEFLPEVAELPPALRSEMDRFWAEALDRAAESGVRLFDGALAQYLGHRVEAGSLHLKLGRTSYRQWRYSAGRQDEIEARFGVESATYPLALCAALITADERLLVQERSLAVAEGAGLLHVPGGHLDPDQHLLGGKPDPATGMRTELFEELTLAESELLDGRLVGFGESLPERKPELLFVFRCRLDSESLQARAASGRDAYEHSRILFVPAAREDLASWRKENEAHLATPSRALLSRLGSARRPSL